MQFHQKKAVILERLAEYLRQDHLQPFSVFCRRYGFPLGFDIPACKKILKNNYFLDVVDDQVVNLEAKK